MRVGQVGVLLLLVTAALAFQPGAAQNTHVQPVHAGGDVDLHALCESLARDCSDLDPADYGATPVTAALPPPHEGTLLAAEDGRSIQVKASLLGQRLHLHGAAGYDLSAGYHAEGAGDDPAVPCGDPDGCPDLSVDVRRLRDTVLLDTRTFTADHCAVQENSTEAGERKLLRFSFKSPNLGLGDLVVGDPDDHPEWFEWGDCHGHWHFREYADYRLWDPAGYAAWKTIRSAYPHLEPEEALDAFPELRDHFRAGHKQGFCVIDLAPATPLVLTAAQYRNCADDQGISVNWADEYHRWLDGQWVDVTGLPPGEYVLEAEVNPERFFAETLYGNNDSAVVVQVP